MISEKWDRFYLGMAKYVSTASKDPSTQTGGVIVRPDRTVVSVGFNGFPRGIYDDPELLNNREEKYKRVVHSEMNAILSARESLQGYTLYNWPGQSCERCAVHVIQVGIKRVVSPKVPPEGFAERFAESWKLTEALFDEAGVLYWYV